MAPIRRTAGDRQVPARRKPLFSPARAAATATPGLCETNLLKWQRDGYRPFMYIGISAVVLILVVLALVLALRRRAV
jgi:hypothetical protein